MKACVVFATRVGSTERIARSIEAGLTEARIETTCVNASSVASSALKEFDLICIGAPTEAFSASRPMKDFLRTRSGRKVWLRVRYKAGLALLR